MKVESTATIAIITRTKDRPLLLKRALKSVAMQGFNNYLHLVINDGGDEKVVADIIKELPASQQEKTIHLCNNTSIGMEASSNRAIRASNSEYIVLLDDDDSWEPTFLSTTINYLNTNQGAMGIATKCNYIQEEIRKNKVTILNSRPYKPNISTHTLFEICAENNILVHSFVYRRTAIKTIGPYDETLSVLGDWDFNLRFLRHFDIPLLPVRLANYHVRNMGHSSNYSNTITNEIDLHKHTRMIINNRELRKDIISGDLGIGFLINSAPHTIKSKFNYTLLKLIQHFFDRSTIGRFLMKNFPNKHARILRRRFHE